MLETDLRQDELLHWFVPHPVHQGPCADGTEASSDHGLLQKKKKNSHHQEFMNVQIYLLLHWILPHRLLYLIKTSNRKWLLSLGVNIWGGTSRVLQLPPGCECPQKAAYLKQYVPRSRLCYPLVQLEKLHGHIALKFRLPPTGKHPQPGDHHRVEDLEIQGDGRHISGDEHRGVRHHHDLYLCILACHWNRGTAEIAAQAHKIFITIPTCWPSLFGDEDRASRGEGERSAKKEDSGKATPSAVWGAGS